MSELNDFINAQHTRDLEITRVLEHISTVQEDMSARLFGGPNQKGMLPFMIETANSTAAEFRGELKIIDTRTGALEGWKRSSRAWVAGAVAVLGLEGTALGLYFNHIAGHVISAASILHK